MIRIRQVATLLGYGEPQILEVFKNTLPTKLYWVLFPVEDLRQAVETAKRILTKEKLDRQLTGQTSTSPFMNIRDGTDKRVSFNTRDELGDKIDKLTVMMSKLVAKDSHERKPFKPQIYKSRGQSSSHDHRTYQTRPNDRNRRYNVNNSTRQNFKVIDSEKILEEIIGRILGRGIEVREIIVMIELGIGIGQETEILRGLMEGTEALIAVDPAQDPEQVQIGTE